MVVEDFPQFYTWFFSNIQIFGLIILAAALFGLIVGYVVSVFKHGPFEAFYVVAAILSQAVPDFIHTSPRRVGAIARLAIKEALHRRVILVTFGIFAVALLFGGWFVDAGSEKPEQLYVSFVMWGTQMLILLMGLLLSAFSIPEDIKNRTVYTVVTKPVRTTEIILGRVVGFGLLGTLLLGIMGLLSYFFVVRGLSHIHYVAGETQTLASFVDIDPNNRLSSLDGRRVSDNAVKEAQSTFQSGHKHRLELVDDIRLASDPPPKNMEDVLEKIELSNDRVAYRRIRVSPVGGHQHLASVVGTGDDARVVINPAVGYFRARVPIYASRLTFTDREGMESTKGINVGREWSYRGYIDGGSSIFQASLSEGRFDFENFNERLFGNNVEIVPLEMTLSVFRTYKADIEKRVTAGIQFESIPDSELDNKFVSDVFDFETNEFTIQTLPIARTLVGKIIAADGKTVGSGTFDLFNDYAANGKLRIRLSCRDTSQYIGVSRADLYFRAADRAYAGNFVKGFFGIWCQMMMVIALGVALSTFLSSPITMLGAVVVMVVGFFTTFIRELMSPESVGGGPIESLVRVITQENMVTSLETGVATTIMVNVDKFLVLLMAAFTYLVPNFAAFDFSDFLTYGYAIDPSRISVALTSTLAFCFGFILIGYFALKTREIAK